MSTDGMLGHGTTLSGATTGAIAEIVSVNLTGMEADDIDLTTMDATNAWRVFEAGLKDPGGLDMELLYEDDNADAVIAALGGSNEDWTVTFPDGATFVCEGYVKGTGIESPVDGRISQPANIKFSGEPTFTGVTG